MDRELVTLRSKGIAEGLFNTGDSLPGRCPLFFHRTRLGAADGRDLAERREREKIGGF